jgi:hypothetical protein
VHRRLLGRICTLLAVKKRLPQGNSLAGTARLLWPGCPGGIRDPDQAARDFEPRGRPRQASGRPRPTLTIGSARGESWRRRSYGRLLGWLICP